MESVLANPEPPNDMVYVSSWLLGIDGDITACLQFYTDIVAYDSNDAGLEKIGMLLLSVVSYPRELTVSHSMSAAVSHRIASLAATACLIQPALSCAYSSSTRHVVKDDYLRTSADASQSTISSSAMEESATAHVQIQISPWPSSPCSSSSAFSCSPPHTSCSLLY